MAQPFTWLRCSMSEVTGYPSRSTGDVFGSAVRETEGQCVGVLISGINVNFGIRLETLVDDPHAFSSGASKGLRLLSDLTLEHRFVIAPASCFGDRVGVVGILFDARSRGAAAENQKSEASQPAEPNYSVSS